MRVLRIGYGIPSSEQCMPHEEKFPLKRPPAHGVYLRWPLDGCDWIHPEDVEIAVTMIPSRRVFLREDFDDQYVLLTYGQARIRVRPTMWTEVQSDGYEVGDQVEIRSQLGKREPAIATIEEIFWNRDSQSIEYHLHSGDRELRSPYTVDEFQPVFRLGEPMTRRQQELAARYQVR